MTLDQIKKKYKSRIMAILDRIATAVRKAGYRAEIYGYSSDNGWEMLVSFHPRSRPDQIPWKDDIDINIEIIESEDADGSRGGVAFKLGIVDFEGRVLGNFIPFNYTQEIWVPRKDKEAVEERFRVFESQCDPYEVMDTFPEPQKSVKDWSPED